MAEYVNSLMPGAYEKLKGTAMKKGDSRLAAYDNHMKFEDKATGEIYSYESDMSRDFVFFIQIAPGQMMSTEEVIEMYEGLNVSNWKDIDHSDPEQAAAAKDLYLKSFAKILKSFFNEQKRIVRTYGMLPSQLPPMAFILASNGGTECINRQLIGVASEDLKIGGVKIKSDGREMNMHDLLVEKGYLSKEYVEQAIKMSDFQGGISSMTNALFDNIRIFWF